MYTHDLVRLELPYPPMFYEALGYDPTSWDAAFFWRSGRFLWTDMGETGFGHVLGWRAFLNHSVIANKSRCRNAIGGNGPATSPPVPSYLMSRAALHALQPFRSPIA